MYAFVGNQQRLLTMCLYEKETATRDRKVCDTWKGRYWSGMIILLFEKLVWKRNMFYFNIYNVNLFGCLYMYSLLYIYVSASSIL